jgi:hypothetical protein
MRVKIHGPNLIGSKTPESFHVHAFDCKDNRKPLYRGERPWDTDVASEQEAVEAIYSDQIAEDPDATWEDYATDVRIFPCVKLELPVEVPVPAAQPELPRNEFTHSPWGTELTAGNIRDRVRHAWAAAAIGVRVPSIVVRNPIESSIVHYLDDVTIVGFVQALFDNRTHALIEEGQSKRQLTVPIELIDNINGVELPEGANEALDVASELERAGR